MHTIQTKHIKFAISNSIHLFITANFQTLIRRLFEDYENGNGKMEEDDITELKHLLKHPIQTFNCVKTGSKSHHSTSSRWNRNIKTVY